jgi:hypothetical protein
VASIPGAELKLSENKHKSTVLNEIFDLNENKKFKTIRFIIITNNKVI